MPSSRRSPKFPVWCICFAQMPELPQACFSQPFPRLNGTAPTAFPQVPLLRPKQRGASGNRHRPNKGIPRSQAATSPRPPVAWHRDFCTVCAYLPIPSGRASAICIAHNHRGPVNKYLDMSAEGNNKSPCPKGAVFYTWAKRIQFSLQFFLSLGRNDQNIAVVAVFDVVV